MALVIWNSFMTKHNYLVCTYCTFSAKISELHICSNVCDHLKPKPLVILLQQVLTSHLLFNALFVNSWYVTDKTLQSDFGERELLDAHGLSTNLTLPDFVQDFWFSVDFQGPGVFPLDLGRNFMQFPTINVPRGLTATQFRLWIIPSRLMELRAPYYVFAP